MGVEMMTMAADAPVPGPHPAGHATGRLGKAPRRRLSHRIQAALVVATALVIIFASVLSSDGPYHLLGGGWGGDEMGDPTIQWSGSNIEVCLVDGAYRWNVSRMAERLLFFDDDVRWASLNASIVPWDYHHRVNPEDIRIPARLVVPRPLSMPAVPTVVYEERAGMSWRLDPGDIIGVCGADRSLQECAVSLGITDHINRRHRPFLIPSFNETFEVDMGECAVVAPLRSVHFWEATVPVLSTSPSWEKVPWAQVRIMYDRFDEYLVEYETIFLPLSTYPGALLVNRTNITAFYQEEGTGDGLIGPGDLIKVAGIGQEWAKKRLALCTGHLSLTSITISQYFPSPTLNLTLEEVAMTPRITDKGRSCDAEYNVTWVEPADLLVHWNSTVVHVCERISAPWYYASHKHIPNRLGTVQNNSSPVLFVEEGRQDGIISVGDRLIVSGLEKDFCDGLVVIVLDDLAVGSVRLPYILPGFIEFLSMRWVPPVRRLVS